MGFGNPSFVGIKKIRVSASASGVAAGGTVVVEVSIPTGVMVGLPILVSKGAYTGDVRVLYAKSGGFVVELTNSDGSNPQDVSAVFEVYLMPDIL